MVFVINKGKENKGKENRQQINWTGEYQRILLRIDKETNQEFTVKEMEEEETTDTSQSSTKEHNQIEIHRPTSGIGVVTEPVEIPRNTPQPTLASRAQV